MKQSVIEYLQALDQLHVVIFSVYIRRDYPEHLLAYEKKTIKHARILFNKLDKVRTVLASNGFVYDDLIACLEHLYEIMFSLNVLKLRLLDHTTFEIAHAELKNMSKLISQMITEKISYIKDKNKQSTDLSLTSAIQHLEVIFQNAIQFVVADPLVFVFFIRDLMSLNTVLVGLQNEIQFEYR